MKVESVYEDEHVEDKGYALKLYPWWMLTLVHQGALARPTGQTGQLVRCSDRSTPGI